MKKFIRITYFYSIIVLTVIGQIFLEQLNLQTFNDDKRVKQDEKDNHNINSESNSSKVHAKKSKIASGLKDFVMKQLLTIFSILVFTLILSPWVKTSDFEGELTARKLDVFSRVSRIV